MVCIYLLTGSRVLVSKETPSTPMMWLETGEKIANHLPVHLVTTSIVVLKLVGHFILMYIL